MRRSKENSCSIKQRFKFSPVPLIPAKAGIQIEQRKLFSVNEWIPAFAGTSGK